MTYYTKDLGIFYRIMGRLHRFNPVWEGRKMFGVMVYFVIVDFNNKLK